MDFNFFSNSFATLIKVGILFDEFATKSIQTSVHPGGHHANTETVALTSSIGNFCNSFLIAFSTLKESLNQFFSL
jgi:hypothetical protein